jgi:hypothetical protein
VDVQGVAIEGETRVLWAIGRQRGENHESDYGNGYGSALAQPAGDGGGELRGVARLDGVLSQCSEFSRDLWGK